MREYCKNSEEAFGKLTALRVNGMSARSIVVLFGQVTDLGGAVKALANWRDSRIPSDRIITIDLVEKLVNGKSSTTVNVRLG